MTHLRSLACSLLVASAALHLCPAARGQGADLGKFDPSTVYFQAWLIIREAEKDETTESFLEAFKKYDKAKQLFDAVALYHPEWQPELVKDRQDSTATSMTAIRDKAMAEQQKVARSTKGLVEGPGLPAEAPDFDVPQLSPEEQQKVEALQRQIMQYRSELNKARNDRDANAVRLRNALKELEAERDRMARAPVSGQMDDLNARIRKIERERDAMARALRDSRDEQQTTLAQLATVKADAIATKDKADEYEQMVEVQQRSAKQVVEGLRRQLKEVKELGIEKDKQIATLEARYAQLERQLEEAHAEILDLREERDALLVERDQMAALLKLNESERVRLLIKQNMDFGRDLKLARERLQELLADNNSTKDQLTEAKRDIGLAKAYILELRNESDSKKVRLEELEGRLRATGEELQANLAKPALDPASRVEMELLRGIISRQLRVQEHRKLQKEAVMTEIERRGLQDSSMAPAITALFDEELKLTEEESELLSEFKVDKNFIFADRPDRQEVINAGQELQQNIAIKDQLARRAYSNGRFLAAREVLESIRADHPGHIPTILNLGVVHLKNDEIPLAIDAFNDALVIRPEVLPFAHYMLGVCYYRSAEYARSRECLERSLQQDPNQAEAHVFLGSLAGGDNNYDEAEQHFKKAISLDPTLTEPYYNLAVIYEQRGSKGEALKYYREALKNGAELDADFERRLSS